MGYLRAASVEGEAGEGYPYVLPAVRALRDIEFGSVTILVGDNGSGKSTIVEAPDRTDDIGHVGAGFRIYATRRFLLRAEYKSYVVFTSRDENEEIEEWKVGFAFFF